MKMALSFLILIGTGTATFAAVKPVAHGKVTIYNSARSYEVVIDGPAAEILFKALETPTTEVNQWINKNSNGMTCGQNKNTKKFSCSLSVDQNGLQ